MAKDLSKIDFSLYYFDAEKGIFSKHWKRYLQGTVSQCVNNKLHMEKNLKSHRRYKRSEWYGYDEYLKMVEEGALP